MTRAGRHGRAGLVAAAFALVGPCLAAGAVETRGKGATDLIAPLIRDADRSLAGLPRPAEGPDVPGGDRVFAAFQSGYYLRTFAVATEEAGKGSVPAMTMLGYLYENGLGVRVDPVKAAGWYGLAADRGDREALAALGLMAATGVGVAKDKTAAYRYFEAAAAREHPLALYNLGLMLIEGDPVRRDPVKAADYMRRAARAGSPDAQYAYATMLKEGEGVRPDPIEAARWMGDAAREGLTDAEIEFAIMLFNGRGVAKDLDAGLKLLRKAAYKGSPIAQNRLARVYATGLGVRVDLIEAAKWHLLARGQGLADFWLDAAISSLSKGETELATRLASRFPDVPETPLPASLALPLTLPPRTDEDAPAGAGVAPRTAHSGEASAPAADGRLPDAFAPFSGAAPLQLPPAGMLAPPLPAAVIAPQAPPAAAPPRAPVVRAPTAARPAPAAPPPRAAAVAPDTAPDAPPALLPPPPIPAMPAPLTKSP